MGNTGPAELLAIWEAGLAHHGPGRALLLHRAARPESAADELRSLPVGEREADLYALRRALFGERMQIRAECGACGEAMEFDLDARDLGVRPRERDGPLRVEEGEWTVEFRLPTVADLEAAAHAVAGGGGRAVGETGGRATSGAGSRATSGAGGPGGGDGVLGEDVDVGGLVGADGSEAAEASTAADRARRALLARCLVSVHRAGQPVPADRLPVAELPEPVQRKLAEAAEHADPAADVTLNVACPECGEATRAELDIASYLWAELDHWARDLLLDVHLLATAYGWSEPQILALSPLRRRYYLELCADG
ncbi:T4 family baseplate hub assembly chaperone [Streptomyces melanosporofaciens]|uniref:T4 family baseplate hub assembly chaperone n=1 Tax=unclassified Streptomyces TaxID=2593676 RepID=UPI003688D69E